MLQKGAAAPIEAAPVGKPDVPSGRNSAGRPTLAELGRRKATVMEVATQLFVTQGYAETSLVDIAKRSGVATRTLYQHFGDKEAIFREVVFARRAASMLPPSMPAADATLFEALEREATELIHYVTAERSVDLMRLMVAESRRFPDLMKKVANATFARVLSNVTHVFEVLAERRQVPPDDHARTAMLFVDLILGNGTIMLYAGWRTTSLDMTEVNDKIDLFIAGRFGARYARIARTRRPAKRRATAAA